MAAGHAAAEQTDAGEGVASFGPGTRGAEGSLRAGHLQHLGGGERFAAGPLPICSRQLNPSATSI